MVCIDLLHSTREVAAGIYTGKIVIAQNCCKAREKEYNRSWLVTPAKSIPSWTTNGSMEVLPIHHCGHFQLESGYNVSYPTGAYPYAEKGGFSR